MERFRDDEIVRVVNKFLNRQDGGALDPSKTPGRELSFDFAYNYFQENQQPTRQMEASCMQLGFYLASWGMYRGSSYLLKETNAAHLKGAIKLVEEYNPRVRGIDVPAYRDPGVQDLLVEIYDALRRALLRDKKTAHVTLVTKVMLGVWGVVPAFDSYFQAAAKLIWTGRERGDGATFFDFNRASLVRLLEFYEGHRAAIDQLASALHTVDFTTGSLTGRQFTRAKIIDMFGFQLGLAPPALGRQD
ncbi:hypothetical protein G9U51_09445 [Calidifontibacter sp. DB0510]|uniref:Uncharacterized protein n=1 Tax=Metallococcus carri TaxID=1656884 RepID=A0A967EAL0_9MICO|nr:hypothetical protein [Metallococcus carri]NHN55999.1 hypothetical protein [Metallococcus carri]NOP37544.1 hypothetical protein [Calidifontibacter sp. DB2511S]